MNDNLVNSSFKYCEEITRSHYENFPVASFLIPADKRKYIHAIYAFARAADDFADEPGIEGGEQKDWLCWKNGKKNLMIVIMIKLMTLYLLH